MEHIKYKNNIFYTTEKRKKEGKRRGREAERGGT